MKDMFVVALSRKPCRKQKKILYSRSCVNEAPGTGTDFLN